MGLFLAFRRLTVSTHSRPKAAGYVHQQLYAQRNRFNTQPPEGGWHFLCSIARIFIRFNTQPPEGGWHFLFRFFLYFVVSTHSRPKAAGKANIAKRIGIDVSTHSRPKAAGSHF